MTVTQPTDGLVQVATSDTVAVLTERVDLSDQVDVALGAAATVHRQPWRAGDEPLHADRIIAEIAAAQATVICIGDDVPLEVAYAVAAVADRDHAEASVVLVTAPSDDVWRDALRAGVRDVVDVRAADAELEAALGRALARAARLRQQPVVVPTAPTTGRVIVVLSPKGGSGKTMVASNLAAALGRMLEGSVALVDLDVQFGDAASALGLIPEHTIGQLAQVPTIDSTTLKVFLTRHEPSGAFVLCGSDSPEEGEAVTEAHAARAVQLLAKDFACVVVDTPAGLDERTLAAVELATDVVLVSSMDVSSIRSLGKEITSLERLGMLDVPRHFVLNRADSRVGIDADDVQAALGMVAVASVPSSKSIPLCMNQGRALVIEEPSSQIAREFAKLANGLLGAPADDSEAKPRFLRRRK